MSQFRSTGRRGNYARAGKAAANDALNTFIAARRNSVDYGRLAQDAATIRSNEKVAAIKAQTDVTKAGINAQAEVSAYKTKLDAQSELKGAKRKAGVLAAAGQLTAGGISGLGEEKTKRRDSSDFTSILKEREAKYRAKATDLRNQTDELPSTTATGSTSTDGGNTSGKVASASSVSSDDAWGRLSRVIRSGEGTLGDTGYTTQFTGTQFTDTSQHPRQIRSSGDLSSDAAGAYQFLSTTWDGAKNALGLKDFSPESQEKAGRYLAQQRGVDTSRVYQTKEEFKQAMDLLAPEWASLPYSGKSPSGHDICRAPAD